VAEAEPQPVVRAWATTRPYDLAAVAALAAAGLLAALLDAPGWLRVPAGLAFILFAPGYAFIAALYPERHVQAGEDGVGRRGLQPLERVALSLGLSIAVVPLLGLGLNATPFGIRLVPVLLTVGGFTVACAAIAAWRRRRLPDDERLELRVVWASLPWRQRTLADKAVTVALVLAVLFAAGSLAYVLAKPREGERFTEFYILGPTGKAACYADTFREGRYVARGEDCPASAPNVTIGIINHEGREAVYTVRVVWTLEERLADNTTQVQEARVVEAWEVRLAHRPVDLSLDARFEPQYESVYDLPPPPFAGEQRLSFQLFLHDLEGEVALPPPEALDAPYRRLHLWIAA